MNYTEWHESKCRSRRGLTFASFTSRALVSWVQFVMEGELEPCNCTESQLN